MRHGIALAVSAAALLSGCRNDDGEIAFVASKTTDTVQGVQTELTPASAKHVRSAEQAGWRFLQAAGEGGDGNLAVSPLGFTMTLALLANGLDGPSREAVEHAAGMTPGEVEEYNEAMAAVMTAVEKGPSPPVTVANAVWMVWPSPVRPEYAQTVSEAYRAKVVNLGSAGSESVNQINRWCEKQTRGRIKRLVDRLDRNDSVLFTNALAFDFVWPKEFGPPAPKPFRTPGGAIETPTVSGKRGYKFAEADGVQAAWIPCDNGSVALLLPPRGEGRAQLAGRLAGGLWERLTKARRDAVGELSFPVISVNVENVLSPALEKLVGRSALQALDLRFVSHDLAEGQFVAGMTQRVVLELDEAGARGAAATSVRVSSGRLPEPEERDFAADRPFMAVATERRTGLVLLSAWVSDPRR